MTHGGLQHEIRLTFVVTVLSCVIPHSMFWFAGFVSVSFAYYDEKPRVRVPMQAALLSYSILMRLWCPGCGMITAGCA